MVAVVRRVPDRRPANARPGIATLEFVLVFPFLCAMVAGIFLVARADVHKTSVVTAARNEAWKKRPNANPGEILKLLNDPMKSEVSGEKTSDVPKPKSSLFAGPKFVAQGKNLSVGRTWDRKDLPFNPGRPHLDPHRDELTLLANNIPALGSIVNAGLTMFSISMSPERNPVMIAAAIAGKIANALVKVAGITLHLLSAPLNIVLDLLEIAASFLKPIAVFKKWARKMLRFVNNIIKLVRYGLNVFEALYQASKGRPGVWVGNIPDWLKNFKLGP